MLERVEGSQDRGENQGKGIILVQKAGQSKILDPVFGRGNDGKRQFPTDGMLLIFFRAEPF